MVLKLDSLLRDINATRRGPTHEERERSDKQLKVSDESTLDPEQEIHISITYKGREYEHTRKYEKMFVQSMSKEDFKKAQRKDCYIITSTLIKRAQDENQT